MLWILALIFVQFTPSAWAQLNGAPEGSYERKKDYPWRVSEKEKVPAQANLYKEGTQNYAFQAVYLLKQIQLLDPKGRDKKDLQAMIRRNSLEKFCSKKNKEFEKNPKKCLSDYRATLAAQVKKVERKLESNQIQTGELEDDQVRIGYSVPKTMRRKGRRSRILPVIEVSFEKDKKGITKAKVRVPYVPTVSDMARVQKGLAPFRQRRVMLNLKNRLVSSDDLFRSVPLEVLSGNEFQEFAANFPTPPRLEDYRRYRKVLADPSDPGGKTYLEAIPCGSDETCYDQGKFQADMKLYQTKFADVRKKYLEMVADSNNSRNLKILQQGEKRYSIESLYQDKYGRSNQNYGDLPETYQALLSARASLIKAGNQAVQSGIPDESQTGVKANAKLSAESILEKVRLDRALSKDERQFLKAEFRRLGEAQVIDPGRYSTNPKDQKHIYLTLDPEDIRKALNAIYVNSAVKDARKIAGSQAIDSTKTKEKAKK